MPRCLSAVLPQYFFNKKGTIAITTLALALVVASVSIALPRSHPTYAAGSPTFTVTPTSGAYTDRDDQTPIKVRGTNYSVNETVNVYWNYTGPGTGILEATTTADSKGTFATSFLYQLAAYGTYTIAGVGQTSGIVITASFTLYPQLSIRPQASGPGTLVSFGGNAFAAGETVNIYWKYNGPGTGTLLATGIGNSTGSFTVNGTILKPPLAPTRLQPLVKRAILQPNINLLFTSPRSPLLR